MKQSIFSIISYTLLFLILPTTFAGQKYLILAEGNDWKPIMAPNFVKNYKTIKKLPFNGFALTGNSCTNRI